ncbi:XisI protein [Iningainema tapete]|uniref:XisI protein n=1 Tax=Iningainema tapete BLCC-T55 TaxID=2748662 RepID=A0A8J6XDI5_9CYAN|nr:XisI protein [Iningainema tapete]MBD2774035.1 XisI protein [Iningainema tapete BLCC-T55]
MEKLAQYRKIVQQMLLEYGKQKLAYGDIEVETIFDPERDHYQIMHVGWDRQDWVHSCVIHIDIKGGKIWLQWNGTEDDIAADLVAAGVPKEDIVLGFQSPFMRKFTEYAVG